MAEQATVMSDGAVIVGKAAGLTVIVCTQVDALPQLSVAVQVRVITELTAQLPAAVASAKVMTGTALQLSVAVAVPSVAGVIGSSQLTVTLAGQVMTGAVMSSTFIVCPHVALFPATSFIVHVLVTVIGQVPAATS